MGDGEVDSVDGARKGVGIPDGIEATLVHDWVTQWGGPESVLRSLVRVLGEPSVHVGVWNPDEDAEEAFRGVDVRPTWLQRLPGARYNHRLLLPLMPRAFGNLSVEGADLVVSSSHSFAKAVKVPDSAVHICYCHTPPRYLWDQFAVYNQGLLGQLRKPVLRRLRKRDQRTAQRVDHFLANSRHVAGRIRRNYGREARVIYPPVDVERFWVVDRRPEGYYLTGGRLSVYKRIEAAIKAANFAKLPLKVFGDGPERRRLEALAGPTVEFLGSVGSDELPELMAGARAFIHPGKEDFGILPVEAQAAGCPVVAWNEGGARETVNHGETGVLYDDPSPLGVLEGIQRLEEGTWSAEAARRNAERFNRRRFEEEISEEVYRVLKGHRLDARWDPVPSEVRVNGHHGLNGHAVPNGNGRPTKKAVNGKAPHRNGGDPHRNGSDSHQNGGGPHRRTRNLITGGAGFIGSHLAEALLARGEEVDVVDDLSTGERANIAHLLPDPRFHFYRGSVTDRALMDDRVREADRVFHLAAAVGVKLIMERPVDTVVTNVRGTEIVLEMAAHYRKKVLVASTSEVYGKAMETGQDPDRFLAETDNWTLGPTSRRRWAYACSKAMDEFLALAYRDDVDLPVVVVRFFNTVGPRQMGRYGMVIPNFVKSALDERPITVHGDGEQTRCFTHVADAIHALTRLIECREAHGEVVNIGNEGEISMNGLARRVKELTGSSSEIRHVPYEEVYGPGFEDMRRRTPDLSKVRELIGYEPQNDLDRILKDVIAYYRHEWKPTPFQVVAAEATEASRVPEGASSITV